MILVNGCKGIGTGWCSKIPCFNPHAIVESLKSKLKGNGYIEIEPWYKGYQGEFKKNPNKEGIYTVKGKYHWSEEDPNKFIITEIPIKKWTEDYKYFLQELMGIEILNKDNDDKKKVKKKKRDDSEEKKKKKKEIIIDDLRENHTYNRVCFEVTLKEDYAAKFKKDEELFIKTFNLTTSLNINNMVLFSPEGKLKKYNSIEEILETFYKLRLEFYHIRKEYMISVLKKEVATLSNKARFIKMVIEDELIIKKKKRVILVNELYDLKFHTQTMLNNKKMKTKEEKNAEIELQNNTDNNNADSQNTNNNGEEEVVEEGGNKKVKLKVPIKEYDYLLNMNLWSLTYEKIEELLKQKEQKEKELNILEKTEVETLWDNDLNSFVEELDKYEQKEEEDRIVAQKLNKGKGGKIPRRRRGGGGGRKKNGDVSDNSSVNIENSENDSNNTSLISDTTANITKEKKEKKTKNKKKDNQTSIIDFVSSDKKEKKDKSKNKEKTKDKNKSKSRSKNKSQEKKKRKKDSTSPSISEISITESKNITESSVDEDTENDNVISFFKMPLKERLKQRRINIGDSPLPFENLAYGPDAKKNLNDDLSDFDLSFNDKEKIE